MFKTSVNRERYLPVYQQRLAKWKIAYTTRYVTTSSGRTFVIECGNPEAQPLVLLHGFSGTSTMWGDVAASLENDFHIFAIDIIADINLSEPSVKVETSADFAKWLAETVASLGAENCYAIGESYGAWQIMNSACRYPELFRGAIIINPMPGLSDFTFSGNLQFMLLAINPSRGNVAGFLRKMVVNKDSIDEGFIDLFYTAFNTGTTGIPSDGYVLGDEQLADISMPAVYLIGDNDIFASAESRFKRKHAMNRNSEMVLIGGAGHDMVLDRPDLVVKYAKERFLRQ